MQPVESSNIEAVGHDPATNTLSVRFRGGNTYHYPNFTAAQFETFLKAESAGKHFHTHIRSREAVKL